MGQTHVWVLRPCCVIRRVRGRAGARCARTFSVMMAASLAVRMRAYGKAPPGVFRRGLGVRGGGVVVSLT